MTSVIADNNNTNNAQIGLKPFFKSKVEALEIAVRDGTQNLRRLEAQRNELNSRGKLSLSLSLSLS
jgi:26S proteasome regulatory subunit T6